MKRFIPYIASLALCAASLECVAQTQTQPVQETPAARGAERRGAGDGFGFGAGQGRGIRGRAVAVLVRTGPSAPVPAAVAIPRPSADELTQINNSLKQFIENDSSPTKPLLKKYESMLTIQAPRRNIAATFTQTPQRQGLRHDTFVGRAKNGDIDLLLHGDSITDWWVQDSEKEEMFDKYFGDIKTANFAIAGDTTQGVLWGLANGEGQGFSPKAVMLMIGTNNTASNTPPEIAEGIGAVVMEMRKDFPNAKILLLAIFPRGNPGDAVRDRITEVNKLIAKLDDGQHVFYMDIGPKFLDENGAFLADAFQTDLLHPAPKGYDIWGAAVKDKLAELMK